MEFMILAGLVLAAALLVELPLWAFRRKARNSVTYLLVATVLRGLAYTPGVIAAGHGAIPVPNGLGLLLLAITGGPGDGMGYFPIPWLTVPLAIVFFVSVFVRQQSESRGSSED